ncbi:MAG TPA: type II CAAX endopeptidase family protein [Gemmatimonadales bacterium]|nr:type II CAAX endopeptidase family protein [Gemmatimonadales bacterium]
MSSSAVPAAVPRIEPVAPWWHTLLVMAPIAVGSIASGHQHGYPNANLPGMGPRLSSYLTVLAIEWVPVLLIWLALRERGLSLGTLVSGRWRGPRDFFRDLGLGVAFLGIAVVVIDPLGALLGAKALEGSLAHVAPRTVPELVVYLVMALSAGFCEELIFRGYLTRQFSAWTGSVAAGILLQGIAFGLGHGYYRWVMVAVTVLAWLLGLLARWRKSLLPGMLFHAVQDVLGGVVAFVTGHP